MSDTTTCPVCGSPMTTRRSDGRVRTACSRPCATSLSAQRRALDRIEDIEWLLECDTPAVDIARRVGANPAALERQMHRYDRPDLAAIFAPLAWQASRRECECGTTISRSAARCQRCAIAARKYTQPTRCLHEHILASEERARYAALRAAVRHVEYQGGLDPDELIPAAKAALAKVRADIEWHDATCEACRPTTQEAS